MLSMRLYKTPLPEVPSARRHAHRFPPWITSSSEAVRYPLPLAPAESVPWRAAAPAVNVVNRYSKTGKV